ncbi:BRD7 [Cordylochernes scorpioides]|uniref:BRD7 n=1 Tax=Cordylochernes scorpioides TaxID=51811 RepID=A0ABY6LGT1_9ARAC|nr:BRD7 [Cordylochernes scorpioides]
MLQWLPILAKVQPHQRVQVTKQGYGTFEKRKAEELDDLDLEPPPKMQHLEEPPPQRMRDPRSCTLRKRAAKSPLQLTLCYLLKNVEKKDNQQFFAWPVSDVIAPGYSSIISHPMDLSTIRKKIDNMEYFNITEFKSDVKLMCENAMTYNRPDTVYFKAAKKLLHFSSRLLSKEQLQSMRRQLPCMADLTLEEMGLEGPEAPDNSNPASEEDHRRGAGIWSLHSINFEFNPTCGCRGDGGDDSGDDEAQKVLTQARQAAREAAHRLSLERPGSRLGFLRQDHVGATTLAILHPSNATPDIPVPSLEALTGRLAQGSANILGFKEDPKNVAKPVSYLSYGPFSSYAPYYDSMFSNLTKEESDLILSTYGDDVGVQYADRY